MLVDEALVRDEIFFGNDFRRACWLNHMLENFHAIDTQKRQKFGIGANTTISNRKEVKQVLTQAARLTLEQGAGGHLKLSNGINLATTNSAQKDSPPSWITHLLGEGGEIFPWYYMPAGKSSKEHVFQMSSAPSEEPSAISEAQFEKLSSANDMDWICTVDKVEFRGGNDRAYSMILDHIKNWYGRKLQLSVLRDSIYRRPQNIMDHKPLSTEIRRLEQLQQCEKTKAAGINPSVRKPKKRNRGDDEQKRTMLSPFHTATHHSAPHSEVLAMLSYSGPLI